MAEEYTWPPPPPTKEQITEAFNKADKDGNEKLCLKELKTALLDLADNADLMGITKTDAFVELMMDAADEDKDKMMTLDEVLNLLDMLDRENESGQKKLMVKMIKASDKDGNGYITAAELKNMFYILEDDEEEKAETDEMVAYFMSMGSNHGEKKLKIEELIKIMDLLEADAKEEDPKEKMRITFRMCDTDGDGFVSKKELASFGGGIFGDNPDDPDTKMMMNMMVTMVDEDGDGKLSYEEFCKVMDK